MATVAKMHPERLRAAPRDCARRVDDGGCNASVWLGAIDDQFIISLPIRAVSGVLDASSQASTAARRMAATMLDEFADLSVLEELAPPPDPQLPNASDQRAPSKLVLAGDDLPRSRVGFWLDVELAEGDAGLLPLEYSVTNIVLPDADAHALVDTWTLTCGHTELLSTAFTSVLGGLDDECELVVVLAVDLRRPWAAPSELRAWLEAVTAELASLGMGLRPPRLGASPSMPPHAPDEDLQSARRRVTATIFALGCDVGGPLLLQRAQRDAVQRELRHVCAHFGASLLLPHLDEPESAQLLTSCVRHALLGLPIPDEPQSVEFSMTFVPPDAKPSAKLPALDTGSAASQSFAQLVPEPESNADLLARALEVEEGDPVSDEDEFLEGLQATLAAEPGHEPFNLTEPAGLAPAL